MRSGSKMSCVWCSRMFSSISMAGGWAAGGLKFKLQVWLQNVNAEGFCHLGNGEGATSGNHTVICTTTPELYVHAGRWLWLWSGDMDKVLGYLHSGYPMWWGASRLLVNHHRGLGVMRAGFYHRWCSPGWR